MASRSRISPVQPVEISWQSVIGSLVISTLLAFSYPYIVLKLGLGPSISILAALLGAVWYLVTASKSRGANYLGINVIQTMATVASGMAFMCIVYAAFAYLDMNESVNIHVHVSPMQMFIWLSLNGAIGVLVAGLFRRYFLDDPEMIFPDGKAAAVTIKVLDSTDSSAHKQMSSLGFGTLVGGLVGMAREGFGKLGTLWFLPKYMMGIEWSVLSLGTGMLVSINVGLSMLLGALIVAHWGPAVMHMASQSIMSQQIAPQFTNQVMAIVNTGAPVDDASKELIKLHGGAAVNNFLKGRYFPIVMLWFMWPATIMMITDSLTAVLMRANKIAAMFSTLGKDQSKSDDERDLALGTVFSGIIALTTLLAIVQRLFFHLPLWQTALSVVMSGPLILVGVRVLGLTNQGPVSLMANALQAFFRLLSKNISHNLVAAGMGGAINSMAESMMQCFKTGRMLKASPRTLSIISIFGAIIGAAAVAVMYPLLVNRYGIGPSGQLVAPTALKLANMAVLLSKGLTALPPGALTWTITAGIFGIVLAVLKEKTKSPWLPNASGLGFALILPGTLIIPIVIGSMISWLWRKANEAGYELHNAVLASGLIAGETFVAGLILPVMSFFNK